MAGDQGRRIARVPAGLRALSQSATHQTRFVLDDARWTDPQLFPRAPAYFACSALFPKGRIVRHNQFVQRGGGQGTSGANNLNSSNFAAACATQQLRFSRAEGGANQASLAGGVLDCKHLKTHRQFSLRNLFALTNIS
jgi:hypothetical protein